MGQAEFRALGSVRLAPNTGTGILLQERRWPVGVVVCGVDHVSSRVSQLDGGLAVAFRDQALGFGIRNYRRYAVFKSCLLQKP